MELVNKEVRGSRSSKRAMGVPSEPKTGNIKVCSNWGATENPSTLEHYNTFQEEEREWRRKQEERRRREEEAAGFKYKSFDFKSLLPMTATQVENWKEAREKEKKRREDAIRLAEDRVDASGIKIQKENQFS